MANITLDFLHNYHTGERRESDPAYAYQYDEGHVLEAVLPSVVTTVELHYWIRGMEEAEAYTPTSITPNDDSSCTVLGNIPNKYFETNGELRIYIVVNDASASITTYEGKLNICQRSKPDDYVDDDPDNEATRVLVEARAAAETATAAAETAQDVADSIPSDYSQMSEDVTQLKEDLNVVNDELGITVSIDLDTVAFGGKTYRDIFDANNLVPFGDFENGLDWITTSTNNPVISDEACVSKSHSLKCFGTSSTQIRKDIPVEASIEIAVLCSVRVDRYVSGGGAGFVVGENNLINHVTDGFETLYYRRTMRGATSVFVGTVSSANCDAYIDDFVIIDLTSLFGASTNFPSQSELTELYSNWIAIKNVGDTRLDAVEKNVDAINNDITAINEKLERITVKPIFVGAVMGVSSTGNRFPAMRQLYTVAQKVLDDPTYQTSDSDLTYASEGAVCVLPNHPTGMYQKYDFDILYSKNGTTQAIPASTTKVMTLVTGLDYITNIGERVTIVSDDIQDGSSSILSIGDVVTVKDLIYAMLLNSSNTSAMAFARTAGEKILISQNGEGIYSATECLSAFVSEMAVKASDLGMTNSVFVSPSGRSESNLTTVIDMLRFTIEACSYPLIQKIWNKKSYTMAVKGENERNVDIVTTVTDAGTESLYYIFGGKTGTLSLQQTSIALVLVAEKLS